jgi:hypothetical protein
MKTTVLAIAILVGGCTSLRGRADEAYSRHDYLKAAELYDQLVKANPKDASAVARRAEARDAELRYELVGVQAARGRGQSAVAAQRLGELLDRRDAWGHEPSLALAPGLVFEVTQASVWVGAAVAEQLASEGPLGGEHVQTEYTALLAHRDFATTREALHAQLVDVARTRCDRLVAVASTPYWSWLAARYCSHWNLPAPQTPVLPEQRTSLAVDGAVTGESEAQAIDLRTALSAAFQRSAWFAPSATEMAHATVNGELAVAFSSQPITLTASWTVQVPYTDYETHQESYQEPYDDTESYTEDVPSTEYRTETVPCGDTTCTNTVPETVYHSETKWRTVTKYRTAWRDVTESVTKYRDEQRTQDYSAIERSASYTSSLVARVDANLLAVVAAIDTNTTQSGIEHDVTIAPANVYPQTAGLATQQDFVATERDRLAAALVARLDDAYAQKFCTAATFTLDEAARCAYAGATRMPETAHVALAAVLGGEEKYLAAIVAR